MPKQIVSRIDKLESEGIRRALGGKELVVFFRGIDSGTVWDLENHRELTPEMIREMRKTKKVIVVGFTRPEATIETTPTPDPEGEPVEFGKNGGSGGSK